MRRINIDQATLDLLASRRAACADLLALAGVDL
jgi:hypothetical protein